MSATIHVQTEHLLNALKLFDKCYLKAKKSLKDDFAESGVVFKLCHITKSLELYSTDTEKTAYFKFNDHENLKAFEVMSFKHNNEDLVFLGNGSDISILIKALKAIDDEACFITFGDGLSVLEVRSDTFKFDVGRLDKSESSVISTVEAATHQSPFNFEVILNRKQLKDILASNDSTLVKLQMPDNQQTKVGGQLSEIQGIIKVIHHGGGYQPTKINTLGTV